MLLVLSFLVSRLQEISNILVIVTTWIIKFEYQGIVEYVVMKPVYYTKEVRNSINLQRSWRNRVHYMWEIIGTIKDDWKRGI